MRRCLIYMVMLAFLTSCQDRSRVEEILLEREEVSLTWKGNEQMAYDPLKWQMGYNAGKCEYRLTDDDMANYFVLKCETRPMEVGQDVTCNIEWTLATNIKRYDGLRFTVKKMDDRGGIWLWNRTQKIGVVVRELE